MYIYLCVHVLLVAFKPTLGSVCWYTCPCACNPLSREGGGWSALVVPVFDGQGPTRKPLTSEFHRDVPEQDAYPYSFAHGTSFGSLPYIMAEGMIRPQNWSVLPSLGFFGIACMGWLENDKDSEVLKQLLNNALSIGKGQQDALVLGQVRGD